MSGFKLLGIRAFSDCDTRFSKNLQKGEIYNFYDGYEYLDREGSIIGKNNLFFKDDSGDLVDNNVYEIRKNSETVGSIYDIERPLNDTLRINVSALVGKNGSGKSSLLEILYAFCYLIALYKGIIPDHAAWSTRINMPNVNHNWVFKKIIDIQEVYRGFRAEIYYEMENNFFSICYNNEEIIFQRSLSKNFQHDGFNEKKVYSPQDNVDRKYQYILNSIFYYTISINYSFYGLNAGYDNSWLDSLFHKNDGYQTPIVINPFRKDGNIDVNSELHLVQSRLLSNLVDESFQVKEVVNLKKVDSVVFMLDYSLFNTINVLNLDNAIQEIRTKLELNDSEFITYVYNAVYTTKKSRISKIELEKIDNSDLLVKYVYRKILKIYTAYDEYSEGIDRDQERYMLPNFAQIFRRLVELKNDRSHITLKLRQVLNAIRFNTLRDSTEGAWEEEADDYEKELKKIKKRYLRLNIEDFIARIKKIKKSYPDIDLIELIPNACYRPSIYIRNKNEVTNFYTLSSGEQHFIHSIQSVLYHISNINSVFNSNNKKLRYNYINLIFDEIELYYHPEFQRTFLSELLNGIRNLNIPHVKGLNILFSSHSTFILSDIRRNSVLKLIDGQMDKSSIKTFGANIHDLLADSFFLDKGFMGEYAKQTINQTIKWLNYEKLKAEIIELNKQDSTDQTKDLINIKESEAKILESEIINKDRAHHKGVIDLVDEPVLKTKLLEMYSEIYPNIKDKEAEFRRLSEELGYEISKKRKN